MARFTLQPLLKHSQHRMEAAERLLRMLKRKQDEAQRQLEQLHQFQGEYQQRLKQATVAGMGIQQLRDYQGFLAKVQGAIQHQDQEVHLARQHWEAAHKQWLELRQKVKAYETLAARHQAQENRRIEKREQKLTDERAGRQVRGSGDEGDDDKLA
ncbi:MAG: flagellar export protein FliJ [Hydrogenophilaceae bacterium]|nr:flagellar export protein FliJ [Hydrogenophilaceae bacterium]